MESEVIAEIRRRVVEAGGQKTMAEQCHISPRTISGILTGEVKVTEKIAEKMGFEKRIVWVKRTNRDQPEGVGSRGKVR